MRRLPGPVVLVVVVLGVACSGGDPSTAEVLPFTLTSTAEPADVSTEVPAVAPTATEVPTVPTPVVAATRVPTPTAADAAESPAPTPTPEPTPTLASLSTAEIDVAAQQASADMDVILEVHTRMMSELFAQNEQTVGGVDRYRGLIDELTTGQLKRGLTEGISERQANGEAIVSPGYGSNIREVAVVADGRVQIADCSRDNSQKFDAQGALITPASSTWKLRWTVLSNDGAQWRVEEFRTGGSENCEPDQ